MEQDQTDAAAQTAPAEYQVADVSDMTIAQWERVKERYGAQGYQYAAGLVVFRHAGMPKAPLSVVPDAPHDDRGEGTLP